MDITLSHPFLRFLLKEKPHVEYFPYSEILQHTLPQNMLHIN